MDFAIRQMKNMGWSEGKGLGAEENGIVKPIAPHVQTDTRGLGFSITDSLQIKNQWWAEAYNTASQGMKPEYKITSVGVIVKSKKLEIDEESKQVFGNRFISSGIMLNNKNNDENQPSKKKDKKKKKRKSEESNQDEECLNGSKEIKKKSFDFNVIFAKNNGEVTCHKAARLGIKMSGKMKRLHEQEIEFLAKNKKSKC